MISAREARDIVYGPGLHNKIEYMLTREIRANIELGVTVFNVAVGCNMVELQVAQDILEKNGYNCFKHPDYIRISLER